MSDADGTDPRGTGGATARGPAPAQGGLAEEALARELRRLSVLQEREVIARRRRRDRRARFRPLIV